MYTGLVRRGIITLERLVELMSLNPRRIFGLGGGLEVGAPADIALFDLDSRYSIDPQTFLSNGRATPFDGWEVCGRCVTTIVDGRVVCDNGRII